MREYDFFMKIDADIRFLRPVPVNPIDILLEKKKYVFTNSMVEDNCCSKGLNNMVEDFLAFESTICPHQVVAEAQGLDWFESDVITPYANFFGGWLGFWASEEILHFANRLQN